MLLKVVLSLLALIFGLIIVASIYTLMNFLGIGLKNNPNHILTILFLVAYLVVPGALVWLVWKKKK